MTNTQEVNMPPWSSSEAESNLSLALEMFTTSWIEDKAKHSVAQEKRDKDGKWTEGGAGVAAAKEFKPGKIPPSLSRWVDKFGFDGDKFSEVLYKARQAEGEGRWYTIPDIDLPGKIKVMADASDKISIRALSADGKVLGTVEGQGYASAWPNFMKVFGGLVDYNGLAVPKKVKVPEGPLEKPGPDASEEEIKKWLDRQPELNPSIGGKQKIAIREYKDRGYVGINGYLRGYGDKEEFNLSDWFDSAEKADGMVKAIEAVIAKGHLPYATTLYRAVTGKQFGELKPGDVFHDKGFTSTSMSREVVTYIADTGSDNDIDGEEPSYVLHISAPAGTPAYHIKTGPDDPEELEVLLQAGSVYKITGRSKDSEGRDVIEAKWLKVMK